MTKYKGTIYPNWNSYEVEVEADNLEEAKKEAQRIVEQNAFFIVCDGDLKEVEDE